MRLQSAVALPGGHRTAQLVGFARRVAGGHDGDLHHLFLEQRDAQRAAEHFLQRRRRVHHRFAAQAPLQVGMHHLSFDGPGPHDRHLHHQIVVAGRPEPRQHRHLRAAFDLEGAHGVGALDHGVHLRILGGDVLHRDVAPAAVAQQLQAAGDGAQHADAQHVHLHQAQGVQVVLVPLDDGAVGHGGVFHRHQGVQGRVADHEAAGVLGQMSREVQQLRGERQHALDRGVVRVEAGFAQAFLGRQRAVPAAQGARQAVHLVGGQAQGLGHVADRAAARVRGGDGGERGAFAAVALVHVLDHFLAPGGVEVHVDVGRFAPLARDEALHQHADARRVHFGDAQHVARHRVGGRAAPLADDAAAAGEAHDVVHGEEIRFVLQLGDQGQLAVDLFLHAVGHAAGPAPARAFAAQFAQPGGGRVALGHHFARVFVLQLVQGEGAARGHGQRFGQQLGRVGLCQRVTGAQVAFAVGEQAFAGFAHRGAVADGGDRVLQGAPAARVHVHVAGGHQRQAQRGAQLAQLLQAARVAGAAVQPHRDPAAAGERGLDPGPVRGHRRIARHPQRQHAVGAAGQVGHRQPIAALGRASPAQRDPAAQRLVALQRLRQQHQLRAVGQLHLTAHDQRHAAVARGLEGPHDARHRRFVGDRQRAVAQRLRPRKQLPGRTGPAQEAEVRQAVQLRILRAHANQPCSMKAVVSPGAQKAQARWPWAVSST